MEIANINSLFKRLREEGVDFFDYEKSEPKKHWLCPEDWGKAKRRKFLVDICKLLGVNSWTLTYYSPKRLCCCHDDRCVNPACFTLIKKVKVRQALSACNMSQQDIEELAEQIDMDEWRRLGTKNYLEQYNMSVPPFLRITERALEITLSWMKGSKK